MKTEEAIQSAVFHAVESTFETYLFAEVNQIEEGEHAIEGDAVCVRQSFSSLRFSGTMTCVFSHDLLLEVKKVLMFEAIEDQWYLDYAKELLNSITGIMMSNLLDNELFELTIPEVIDNADQAHCSLKFGYQINDFQVWISLNYLKEG